MFRPAPLRLCVFAFLLVRAAAAGPVDSTDVFVSGEGGWHTYRIPSLIVTPKGALLAFCEGRKTSQRDSGDIDLLLRRSDDGGATWGPVRVLWDDAANTCGNPCPVVDRVTGAVWLFLTHNPGDATDADLHTVLGKKTRTVWVTRSDDDGVSWLPPREITAEVKRPEWTWFATGPGVGIQTAAGRLVIPCDSLTGERKAAYSFVVLSDDHGKTWRATGLVEGFNECQVAERADGKLVLNMRNWDKNQTHRGVAVSPDGGETWPDVARDPALYEPVCQGSLIRVPAPGRETTRFVFSNPAGEAEKRTRMTARLSDDGGKTWPASRLLQEGPAAYSCLAVLPDGRIGCLYERGEKAPYERITLARFAVDWLAGGR